MDPLERMFRHLVRTIEASFPAYLSRPFEVGELYQTILPYRHHRRELGLETNQDYEMAITQLLAGYGGYLIVDDAMRETLQRELASPNPDPGAFREFAGSQIALAPDAVRRVRGGDEPAGRPSFVAPQPVAAASSSRAEPSGAASRPESAAPASRSSLGAVGSGTTAFSAARTSSVAASGGSAGSAGGSSGSSSGAGGSDAISSVGRGSSSGAGSTSSSMGSGSAGSGSGSSAAGGVSRPSEATASLRPSSAAAAPRAATPSTPTGTVRQATPITVAAGQSCRYCSGVLPSGRRIVFCPHCGQDLTTVNCQACGTELELGWKFCTTCGRPVASVNG